jgi:hypothetical protein
MEVDLLQHAGGFDQAGKFHGQILPVGGGKISVKNFGCHIEIPLITDTFILSAKAICVNKNAHFLACIAGCGNSTSG